MQAIALARRVAVAASGWLLAACAQPETPRAQPAGPAAPPPVPTAEASAARTAVAAPSPQQEKNSDGSPRVLPPSPPDEPDFAIVLRYDELGPPSAAGKLLGPEWYAWTERCCFKPDDRFDVRVVVFEGLAREEAALRYPTKEGEADHRLVPLADALRYLTEEERSLDGLDPVEDAILIQLGKDLKKTREKIIKALGEPKPARSPKAAVAGGKLPVVRATVPTVGPKSPAELYRRAILTHRDKFARCADRHGGTAQTLPGTVVQFIIDVTGKVIATELFRGDLSVPPDAREDCFLRVLRRIDFPAPDAGTLTIRYPVDFANQ